MAFLVMYIKNILSDGVVLLSKGIIYQAKVTSEGKTINYVGLTCTATELKAKFRNNAVVSWSVHSSPDQAVPVRALAGDIAFCSWERHFTLAVPQSTNVYK